MLVVAVALLPACCGVAQRVTITWEGQQLGTALRRLASTKPAPLWIDRRVDPQRSVNLQLNDVPFREALTQVTGQHSLAVAEVDGVFYVGPKETAQGLPAFIRRARAELAEAPANMRRIWLRKTPVSWPRLSQPRLLLRSALERDSIEVEGIDLVAHDLWPAQELPPLALIDRVVLLLAGFDLTCEISSDGTSCRVVPIEFPLPDVEQNSPSRTNDSSPLRGTTDARKQFSLRLENQAVGSVMEQLAKQLDLQLTWDETSLQKYGRSPETLVSCQVADGNLDALLQTILQAAGLGFTREGQKVEIHGIP